MTLALAITTAFMASVTRIAPLTDDERAALMVAVRRRGENAASRELGVPRHTIARALARLKRQAGTVLLIRLALGSRKAPATPEVA
jgi:hypothetical protein